MEYLKKKIKKLVSFSHHYGKMCDNAIDKVVDLKGNSAETICGEDDDESHLSEGDGCKHNLPFHLHQLQH